MKSLFICTLMIIATSAFSAVNTQYPGCTPNNSTASELDTKPSRYYPVQPELNKQAVEANEAIRQDGQ